MRSTLLATTAAATMLAFTAVAQQATDPATAPAVTPMEPAAGTSDGTMAPAPVAEDGVDPATPPAMETATPADPAGPVLTPMLAGDISADKLIGASIQTIDGENIASIDDVIVSTDGAVESVVAQFGGFLGFGSNKVLLTMDEIDVMQDEAGNLVVQTALTPESLEGRPDYTAEN